MNREQCPNPALQISVGASHIKSYFYKVLSLKELFPPVFNEAILSPNKSINHHWKSSGQILCKAFLIFQEQQDVVAIKRLGDVRASSSSEICRPRPIHTQGIFSWWPMQTERGDIIES